MNAKKKQSSRINWPLAILVFILGILIAGFSFLFFDNRRQEQEISRLANEIEKLKADDIAIATVINNLLNQLKVNVNK